MTNWKSREKVRTRKLLLESLEERRMLFGATTLAWDHADISYSLVPDGTEWISSRGSGDSVLVETLDSLSTTGAWQRNVATALQSWANHTNLNFFKVDDDGAPRGPSTGTHGDIRLAAVNAGTASGWAAYPGSGLGGDITLRATSPVLTADYWSEERFVGLLQHELGHALGLDHSDVLGTVMGGGRSGLIELGADDIAGIQQLYGVRTHDPFDNVAANDEAATATQLQVDAANTVALRADLTSYADVDYYRLTLPGGTESISVSADARELSLLAPKIQLFDAANQLVAEASGEYGTVATVKLTGLKGGETYTVMVDGATSDVFGMGAYRLAMEAVVNETVVEVHATPELELNESQTEVFVEETPKITETPIASPESAIGDESSPVDVVAVPDESAEAIPPRIEVVPAPAAVITLPPEIPDSAVVTQRDRTDEDDVSEARDPNATTEPVSAPPVAVETIDDRPMEAENTDTGEAHTSSVDLSQNYGLESEEDSEEATATLTAEETPWTSLQGEMLAATSSPAATQSTEPPPTPAASLPRIDPPQITRLGRFFFSRSTYGPVLPSSDNMLAAVSNAVTSPVSVTMAIATAERRTPAVRNEVLSPVIVAAPKPNDAVTMAPVVVPSEKLSDDNDPNDARGLPVVVMNRVEPTRLKPPSPPPEPPPVRRKLSFRGIRRRFLASVAATANHSAKVKDGVFASSGPNDLKPDASSPSDHLLNLLATDSLANSESEISLSK